jgi:predicted secreted protein
MALVNGTDLILKVGTDSTNEVIIAHATSCTLDVSVEEIDQTTKSSGGKKDVIMGTSSFTISVEALYDSLANISSENTAEDLFSLMYAKTKIFFEFTLPTPGSGEVFYSGAGFLSSLSITGGVEDQATYSASIVGTGTLGTTTVV